MEFNAKQNEAIELMATGKFKQREIAERIGLDESNISIWKRDPDFIDKIIKRSREILKASLPDIYDIAIAEATKGSFQHAKLIIEHIEKLESLNKSDDRNITITWK